jgi:hypothetical protein
MRRMNRLALALVSAAFALTPACQDAPLPPEDPVTGGACSYGSAETVATVAAIAADGGVAMTAADGTTFNLRYSQFTEVGLIPEPGRAHPVMKQTITQGTCAPVSFNLIRPPADLAPAVRTDPVDPPVIGGACSYETTVVKASIVQVSGGDVELREASGSEFFLDLVDFTAIDAQPVPGQVFDITKHTITTGTCTPAGYVLKGLSGD